MNEIKTNECCCFWILHFDLENLAVAVDAFYFSCEFVYLCFRLAADLFRFFFGFFCGVFRFSEHCRELDQRFVACLFGLPYLRTLYGFFLLFLFLLLLLLLLIYVAFFLTILFCFLLDLSVLSFCFFRHFLFFSCLSSFLFFFLFTFIFLVSFAFCCCYGTTRSVWISFTFRGWFGKLLLKLAHLCVEAMVFVSKGAGALLENVALSLELGLHLLDLHVRYLQLLLHLLEHLLGVLPLGSCALFLGAWRRWIAPGEGAQERRKLERGFSLRSRVARIIVAAPRRPGVLLRGRREGQQPFLVAFHLFFKIRKVPFFRERQFL